MDDFTVTQGVAPKDIAGLLVSAFEGGASRYWCRIVDYRIPPIVEPVLDAGEKEPHVYPHADYPLLDGGAVVCRINDDDSKETDEQYTPLVLDHAAIVRGLHLMAKQHPRHWGNFVAEEYDAETGDVFLQLCLLGDLVYG